MTDDTRPDQTDEATRQADALDARSDHASDRPPTPEEERAAEEAARSVPESAGEHYREMAETGAEVRGEGSIDGS